MLHLDFLYIREWECIMPSHNCLILQQKTNANCVGHDGKLLCSLVQIHVIVTSADYITVLKKFSILRYLAYYFSLYIYHFFPNPWFFFYVKHKRRSLVECSSCSFPNTEHVCPSCHRSLSFNENKKTEHCALFVFYTTNMEMYVVVKTDWALGMPHICVTASKCQVSHLCFKCKPF